MADIRQPEYRVRFTSSVDEASTERRPEIVITTVREFTSFGYRLEVETTYDADSATLTMDIGGITIPGVGQPNAGPARAVIHAPLPLTGTVSVVVTRKGEAAACAVSFHDGIPTRLEGTQEGGLAVFTVGA